MYHPPTIEYLYSAYKINTQHSDGSKVLSGSATGFVLEIGEGYPWIITNRHVIDLDYLNSSRKYKDFKLTSMSLLGRRADDSEYTININTNLENCFFHEDINNDVVIIFPKVAEGSEPFHWHFGLVHLATEEIFKQIIPFDVICFSGFPQTHDKLMGRPILRCGTIASDPNYDYSWDNINRGKVVAYEGFSTGGNSGSPVFAPPRGLKNIPNSRHGYLIGINAGHIPDEYGHSGISYFYKSTVILEIIEKYNLKTFQ